MGRSIKSFFSNDGIDSFYLQKGTQYQRIEFPDGTKLNANEMLVVANDWAKFISAYPFFDTTRLIINPLMDLNNAGDSIKLYNQLGIELFNFVFNDSLPWKRAADGTGRTMELIEGQFSNFLSPSSWRTSCMYGTPGTVHSPCNEALVISEINYKPSSNTGECLNCIIILHQLLI